MAHRKLQQEIDRVFKKINEGLEIFNTYHERHENASSSSQKEKLESDLKREIKKLQKLREQIKVWQTQNDVKDKEKLLEYRRLVEIAMEKYKVVEKGSKIKAYSNLSLKQGLDLDPEEKEKVDTMEFVQESIDDIERQYQGVEVELDKLLSKKSKKASSANEEKKEELKELQEKYRWHQQNLELALRLLENGELQPSDIQEIKEDLVYFIQSNRDPNFIDNEYIYESLDLDSNEVLSHEVVASFNGVNEKHDEIESENEEKKEDKKKLKEKEKDKEKENEKEKFMSPSPGLPPASSSTLKKVVTSDSSTSTSTPKAKKFVSLSTASSASSSTMINSSITSTLKPATTPVKPPTDMKWSLLAAGGVNDNNDQPKQSSSPTSTQFISQVNTASTSIESPAIAGPIPFAKQVVDSTNNLSNTSLSTTPSSTGSFSPINELEYQQDSELVSLPPGIQDIISSFVSCRKSSSQNNGNKVISNVYKMLDTPRDHLITKLTKSPPPLEALRVSNIWNVIRSQVLSAPSVLGELDNSSLFYAYYYSITPFETHLAEEELIKRQWRSDLNKTNWYQRINQPLKQGVNFEISNFRRFDANNWSLNDLINFKLDYEKLTPLTPSLKEGSVEL